MSRTYDFVSIELNPKWVPNEYILKGTLQKGIDVVSSYTV